MKQQTEDYLRDRVQNLKRAVKEEFVFKYEYYVELTSLQRVLRIEFGEDDLDAK